MDILFSWLSGLSLGIGTLALVVGSLGLIRLPDLFSRTHAVGMMDTAGVGFIILGLLFHEGFSLISVKLAAVAIFLFFTSPIATHAVTQVAHRGGFSPIALKKPTPEKPTPRTRTKAQTKTQTKTKAKTKSKKTGAKKGRGA